MGSHDNLVAQQLATLLNKDNTSTNERLHSRSQECAHFYAAKTKNSKKQALPRILIQQACRSVAVKQFSRELNKALQRLAALLTCIKTVVSTKSTTLLLVFLTFIHLNRCSHRKSQ